MEEGKSIKVLELKACVMGGGDAGNLYDAVGEAIILAMKEDKMVILRASSGTIHTIIPTLIRGAVTTKASEKEQS